jgi:hypothetical protein
VSDLRATTDRLNAIASELRAEDVSDERAEELAREAADLVGEASNELDRALREAASDED